MQLIFVTFAWHTRIKAFKGIYYQRVTAISLDSVIHHDELNSVLQCAELFVDSRNNFVE